MKDKMSDPIQEDELWLLTPSEYYIANNFALGAKFEKSISELRLLIRINQTGKSSILLHSEV